MKLDTILLPNINLHAPIVIALTGAGGKTSTAFWLAQQFKQTGHRVLVTTTTHMNYPTPEQYDYIGFANEIPLERMVSDGDKTGIYYYAKNYSNDIKKVIGLKTETIDNIKQAKIFSVIIVEADGSKQLPLKAPAEHEPCIPLSSDIVIAVTGAEALLYPANPALIHRWSTFATITNCKPNQLIGFKELDRLIKHPKGLFKGTPHNAYQIWLINKIDLAKSEAALILLGKQILITNPSLHAICLTQFNKTTPDINMLFQENANNS